jgi:hypothetical protein
MHIDILAWLIEMDWPKNDDTIPNMVESIAANGNVEGMKLLLGSGFELNGRRVFQLPAELAAEYGHLSMLQYIHENGGELTISAFFEAKTLACSRFLVESGCPLFDG